MRIKCPECGGVLSFDQAKPGSYRPKCKHCQRMFRLQITDEEPPRVGVGRIDAETNKGEQGARAGNARGNDPAAATIDGNGAGATVDESLERSDARSQEMARRGEQPAATPLDQGEDSESPADDRLAVPDRLGGYKILRLIGKGAMGSVYEAKQVSLDRLVALKTIRGKLAENPASLARFAREAYAAAQLTHHNVVQIYDFGEDAGRYFFSMEWVRGGPLDRLIREKGALDPKLAAGYTLQAAQGAAVRSSQRHGASRCQTCQLVAQRYGSHQGR